LETENQIPVQLYYLDRQPSNNLGINSATEEGNENFEVCFDFNPKAVGDW